MNSKLWIYPFVFVMGYTMSFSVVLGVCLTVERIFRYPLKKYLSFCFLTALLYMIPTIIKVIGGGGMDEYTMLIMFIFMIWLCITDRSGKSFVYLVAAAVFSFYTANGITSAFIYIVIYFFPDFDDNYVKSLVVSLAGHIISLMFIILIGYIAKIKIKEPMSYWNMIALVVTAFISGELMIESDVKSGFHFPTIILGLGAITLSIVLSVNSSEKNFYSRISRVNENYLNAQKSYYESLRSSDHEIRRIRHDMKNHIICMNELYKKGKYDKLGEYISGLTDMLNESDKNIHIGNDIADAIINDKLSKAKSCGTALTVSGTLAADEIAPIDICTILANLLDNALEAVQKLDESERKIDLSFKQNLHFNLITVTNPTEGFVDFSKTAKSDTINHGFGISNVKQAAEKYGGEVSFDCVEENGGYFFTAEVIFPKKLF